ncbi:right-handed parallel beta-helix repeat-containing protein [Microbacteriaceae bacterium VKM Ac-2855]|nr:right-handed parallel beta-helix repeat-containing protein [Microbacteriaceae bacterium VKM Ac-2855]
MLRSLRALLIALLVVVATLFVAPAAFAATDRYAAPTGAGTACTTALPCGLATAVQNAPAGSTVYLLSGTYPDVTLKGGKATVASRATITPAPGATPVLARVKSYVANLNWVGLTGSLPFYTYGANQTIDGMHLDGSGLFVRSSNAVVKNSLFENGSSIDGIQVGNATNVLVENNVVRNYDQDIDNGLHADCIQVFESHDVTIRYNKVKDCYNAGLIFSPGAKTGMGDILVESNFIQGCTVVSAQCRGGSSADVREPSGGGTDFVIRNNTFANGSLRVGGVANTVFDRNIVGYLSFCDSPLSNSVIGSWNTKLCAQPAEFAAQGNVQGSPTFVNAAAGDLHLADPSQAVTGNWGSSTPAATDIDGQDFVATLAGADSATVVTPPVVTPPVVTPPTTTPTPGDGEDPGTEEPEEPEVGDTMAPTVEITSPVSGATISGKATITSIASDDTAVTGVSYWIGALKVGDAKETTPGVWSLAATSSGIRGTYALTARAVDAAGNTATSAPVTVTLK